MLFIIHVIIVVVFSKCDVYLQGELRMRINTFSKNICFEIIYIDSPPPFPIVFKCYQLDFLKGEVSQVKRYLKRHNLLNFGIICYIRQLKERRKIPEGQSNVIY